MPVEIRVPPLGESVVEATVGRWTKKEGDFVAKDEILVELETDKITVEVAAQAAGVLGKIQKNEGDTVGVNELLAVMEGAEGATPADAAGQTASARYEGRPERASPAEGYQHRHQQEQNRIVFAALGESPVVDAAPRASL
ncbi:MAG TPA: biotin/lipoyl-containing protein, partial [Longimicrobium sp.]|nr:biotin/lipoyl-containing protein [Longimicrobium sp.]